VIKPRFMQSGLDVPPLLGLLSLLVWGYLLGPPGALLALPLTIAVRRVVQGGKLAPSERGEGAVDAAVVDAGR
jgi:predicted PurR-regulated permease PerM